MLLVRRFVRKFFQKKDSFFSFLRIIKLKFIYPSLDINFGCYVSSGCQITCSDNSRMILTNVVISQNVVLRCDEGGEIIISDTFIGPGSVITASRSIYIDKFCEIAEMVVIRDQNHNYGAGELRFSGSTAAPVKINRNVWLGSKVSVFKGVEIGENSVIAGSGVVTSNVPSNEVWGGIPARKIKTFK